MHEEHTTKASLLASVCQELRHTKTVDHADLALDLINVLGLALRAPDYHTEVLVASMAEISDAAAELLKAARDSTRDEATSSIFASWKGGEHAES